jgi:YVTN family beta-propeller protein
LLAILLLHANEPVSADMLIDGLWGERLPPTALKTLQGYISRLRKVLDHGDQESGGPSNGVLVTRGRGYLLRVEPGELDLDRFRGLVDEGRRALATGDAEEAARILRAGLALWRGPALADFAYESFAQPLIGQAEELHLAALEERVEAELALGRDRDLVGELSALAERNPLRERVRAQLMLALYRSGRQAEALQVYQEYRRALSEQLGLDPSPALRRLEASILNRDPSLELPVNPQAASTPVTGAAGRRQAALRRRGPRPALAASILIAIALVVLVAVSSIGGSAAPLAIAADSVGAISPAGGAIAAQAPVGSSPTSLAAADGAVWVTNTSSNTVSRLDPATHSVVQTIPVGSAPSGVAVGAGAVWVANSFGDSVSRIDPTVGRVVQTIAVGNAPAGVAVGFSSVWVTNASDGTLSRVDAVSGAVIKTIALGGSATDLAVGLGAVWVTDEANGRVLRVDPHIDQVTQAISVGTGPTAIAAEAGSVWVANSLDGTVSRIDPQTNTVAATIAVGDGPDAIAVGARGVWVANEFGGTVSRIDPATDTVTRTTRLGNRPQGLAIAGGLVWVGAQAPVTIHRGGTLIVLSHGPFGSLDPVSPKGLLPSGLTALITNDGLTAFKRVGGSDGVRVVPDLAVSLPTPTDSGLTYTFQLRAGIRYSTGQPVRPADFRHSLERLFELNPGYGTAEYQDIVGAAACLARPAHCDLSRGIVTDDAANTVTFHLVVPDPEFLHRLALGGAVVVPAGTPVRDLGNNPLPATGPYVIVSDTPRQVRLVRNPYFREWSRAARPDGYPGQIVWRIGGSVEADVAAVERHAADYTLDPPPPDRLQELQTRFASQVNVNPNPVTDTLALNTRLAPFNDIRVRRALNYAVDRAQVARILGADSHPTCQVLPPYVPGYRPYCPYTLDPTPDGVWRAPDLTRARALIAASGTRGAAITVWSQPSLVYISDYDPVGRYLVSLLDRLGYRAKLKSIPATDTSYNPLDSRQKVQASLGVYYGLYVAASEFIGPRWTSCQSFQPDSPANLNVAEFCDPRFDATVRSALAAESANSPDATNLWAKADRQFTDQAPFVDLVTPSTIDFVSRRVGDYQYNPVQGALIDQLWVR